MKSALLVIDVQRGPFEASPPPFEATEVLERINALAVQARAANAPVIFIQHERPGTIYEYGCDGWMLDRRLKVEPQDQRLRKTMPDSFVNTDLAALLARLGAERVVICGYASEFCVDTTARRAAALGFAVLLVSDAHTTDDKAHASAAQIRSHQNATLPAMVSLGAGIRTKSTADLSFVD